MVAVEISETLACAGVVFVGRAPSDRWPDERLTFVSNVPDPNSLPSAADFVKKYNAIPIDGTRAGPIALQTYDVMDLIFDAFDRAKTLDRAGIAVALAQSQFTGIGNKYAFDQSGNLIEGSTYVYEYDANGRPQLITP